MKIPVGVNIQRKSWYPKIQHGKNYLLESAEIPTFRDFWKSMKGRLLQRSQIRIGIRRFNYAYERSKPEEKLLDYAISFESLFSKKKEDMDSLGHKLATRSARLLKQDFKERKTIFGDVKSLYHDRSQLVHGNDIKVSMEFLEKIETTLERLFVFY